MIKNYNGFVAELLKAGFCLASGEKNDDVFWLVHGWNEDPQDSPIRWHTGDPDTDPWEWRMRVLDERDDIAYAKLFFKKAGFISKEWYPYFLAARRGNKTFAEEYSAGKASHFAKRIYEAIAENGRLPLEEIKRLAGFAKEEKSKFDGALTELQMKMYLTMCGRRQKTSQKGENFAWASTVFCTTELFWGEDVFDQAAKINAAEAAQKIAEKILLLNPRADEKRVARFIRG